MVKYVVNRSFFIKKGNTTTYTYDAVGNILKLTDPLGEITTYTYDANGNKLTETNPLGQATTYTYDELNRMSTMTDPLDFTTTSAYDALDRVTATINAKGQTTSFAYDAMGRLSMVTDADGGTVQYNYDANGNRLTMTEPNGHTTSYFYDGLNRITQKTEPLGGIYQYVYDAVGNRISITDANTDTISYIYDANNRLITITYPDASSVTFTYDDNGNRTQMVDSLGTTTYTYDSLNRMTLYTNPFNKTVGYSYDENGNRTSITYPDTKVVNYTYDKLNRLSSVSDWLTNTTNYTYDEAGSLTNTLNPNSTTVKYTYDEAGRLIGLTNAKSDTTFISRYNYTLDAIGNHSQVVQDEQLLPVTPDQNISYTYDIENRLEDINGMANTFDANGNVISKGSDTYSYRYENRLLQSTIGGVVTQYSYDALGNRFAKAEGSNITRYILDTNGRLSNVLAETDEQGNITSYYVYGLGLISKVLPDDTTIYYHFDSRGSTIALTDSSENITDKYAYYPFGKLANSTGTTINPFKYVGRHGVYDEGNGLSYIRVRYYIPELGRFITKDSQAGNDKDGQSLNRYVYALNNPVVLIDISGFSAQEGGVVQNNSGSSDYVPLHSYLINDWPIRSPNLQWNTAGTTPTTVTSSNLLVDGDTLYFLKMWSIYKKVQTGELSHEEAHYQFGRESLAFIALPLAVGIEMGQVAWYTADDVYNRTVYSQTGKYPTLPPYTDEYIEDSINDINITLAGNAGLPMPDIPDVMGPSYESRSSWKLPIQPSSLTIGFGLFISE